MTLFNITTNILDPPGGYTQSYAKQYQAGKAGRGPPVSDHDTVDHYNDRFKEENHVRCRVCNALSMLLLSRVSLLLNIKSIYYTITYTILKYIKNIIHVI